jgi:hypothetical protein
VREPEHREHDGCLPRRRFRALQLDDPGCVRRALALPRHPHAHRIRSELALPAHDAERIGRPLERVVVDAHEERTLRVRRPEEPDG